MYREELIKEIIDFGFGVGLFNQYVSRSELQKIFETRLDECEFIESLINTVIVRTKQIKSIDKKRVKQILAELDKIRLELEYR